MHRLRHFLRDINVKPDSGLGIFLTCVIIMLVAALLALAVVALVSIALKFVGPPAHDSDGEESATQDLDDTDSGGPAAAETSHEVTARADDPPGEATVGSGPPTRLATADTLREDVSSPS